MTYRIEFLPEAYADLERIYTFLHPIHPHAAIKAVNAIYSDVERLAEFPGLGKRLSERPQFLQWIVAFGTNGYVIHYRVTDVSIIIVRIWHAREER